MASVGTSIGIVMAPEHDVEPEGLLKRADLALYDAKANGRNEFRLFQPEMLEAADMQKAAENELRIAIERNEFELYYQPVVDAETRLLSGVEALVRWKHPTKGMIPPDHFIPLAESTGLIAPLGEWILRRACTDAVAWPAHVKIAVNISAVQFKKGNLFDLVLCTLMETGLAPERLELEVTETALLENHEAHLTTIRQLKNLGISVALDDFGTGYSSVSYLTIYPFDKIKIDKSFTQGVLARRDYKAVIASTLALAQGSRHRDDRRGRRDRRAARIHACGGCKSRAGLSVRPARSAVAARPQQQAAGNFCPLAPGKGGLRQRWRSAAR